MIDYDSHHGHLQNRFTIQYSSHVVFTMCSRIKCSSDWRLEFVFAVSAATLCSPGIAGTAH